MSIAGTPTALEAPALAALDERDAEPRTPMKRLGSTRKLAAFNNIRLQLAEQTRVLEARAEAAAGVASELGDYCRRRADLEHEYSRALDKLARAALQRHKDHKHKREQWSLSGAFACWQAALDNTRALSRDHAALAELYAGPLAARLQRAADDALRLHRKCKDIVAERHEELGASLAEAAAAGKAHAAAAAEWRAAAGKLRLAHDTRAKLAAAEPHRHKKLKALDKELEKRRARHSAARARSLRARADYVLSLEAANATLQRYYLDDIADIMLCMEVGWEAVVGRAVRSAGAAEGARAAAAGAAAGALLAAADALDALADRQRVVSAHAAAFSPPRPIQYRGALPEQQDEEMREVLADAWEEQDECSVLAARELSARLAQLETGARVLRAECREHAKTLDAAETELVRQMEGADIDVSSLFGPGATPVPPPTTDDDAPRRDQEDYYLAKFRSYMSCAGRLARLDSKAAAVRGRLLGAEAGAGSDATPERLSPGAPPRRAALRRGHFAAPLGERLPTVLTSCVRVISSYGLRHQGLFRVSGSQVEMQALRAAFERGEDPLARVRDASDINSVCGLLKLYLRSLRPPLVPSAAAERLLRVAATATPATPTEGASGDDTVKRLRDALALLPRPNMLVLRYLAAFLAHVAEFSEHNMMDAWNLAICMGPTLVSAGGEGGAQVAAQNLVNELVKRVIVHHAELFPQDDAPHALYKRRSESEVAAELDEADGESQDASIDQEHDVSGACDDALPEQDEPDLRDDLSLYADDDDDVSSDGDSGDWRDRDPAYRHRSRSAERAAPAQESAPSEASTEPLPGAATTARRLAETTPDLVLDLPARASPSDCHGAPATQDSAPATPAPVQDPADMFALNRDTLKKRPQHRHTASEGSGSEAAASEASTRPDSAGGSPVPARNTARVAAKFADMTLTGGSLKPALAAKPALLRRPTPHPAHVRPTTPAAPPVVPAPAETDT